MGSALSGAMSIRAEDAAAEASRFSLRTSFFSSSYNMDTAAPKRPQFQPPPPPPEAAAAATHTRFIPQQPQQQPPPPQPTSAPMWKINVQNGIVCPLAPTQTPHTAPTSLSLSFNSINGSKTSQTANPPPIKAYAHETIASMSRLSNESLLKSHHLKPEASTAAKNRTLPSGYLSGGDMNVGSQAEVMRLSATIDTLNSQLSSQSERLQRTEGSLVRANRSMTSERAISNARLVRLQADVQKLLTREDSIRDGALAQARMEQESAPPGPSFGEVAKQAEEHDAQMTKLSACLTEITGERDSLATDIENLKEDLGRSLAEAAETRLASEAVELSSLASSTAERDEMNTRVSLMTESLDAKTKENIDLVETLSVKQQEYEAIKLELSAATTTHTDVDVQRLMDENGRMSLEVERLASEAAALSSLASSTAERDEMNTQVSLMAESLDAKTKENTGLVETLSVKEHEYEAIKLELSAVSSSQTAAAAAAAVHTEVEVQRLRDENGRMRLEVERLADEAVATATKAAEAAAEAEQFASCCHSPKLPPDDDDDDDYDDYDYDDDHPYVFDSHKIQKVVFDKEPPPLRSRCASAATTLHPVESRISSKMRTLAQGSCFGIATINPMINSRLTRAIFDTGFAPAPFTGVQVETPPHVKALIGAVSKDISAACIKRRRAYLAATGMTDDEIEGNISSFS